MDADALARSLEGLLPPELIKDLRGQNLDEASFRELTGETLKLFGYSMMNIISILRLLKNVQEGKQVLIDPLEETENSEHEATDPDDATQCKDDVLLQYVKQTYIATLGDYEAQSLRQRCVRWKEMTSAGLSTTSRPSLPGVPLQELVHNEMAGKSSTAEQRYYAPTKCSSGRNRAQLFRPTSDSEVDSDEENTGSVSDDLRLTERYKPPALPLDQEALKALRPDLPAYNVEDMLLNDSLSKYYVADLKDGYLFKEKTRKLLFRVIVKETCSKHTEKTNPSKQVKEGIAKSIVVAFPQFQKLVAVPGKMPWSHIYGSNAGHVANIVKRLQSAINAKHPHKQKKKEKKKPATTTCTVDIASLALVVPDRTHRMEVLEGMSNSFEVRQADRHKGLSITELITKYPHLVNYKGEVIAAEFRLMFPDAQDMAVKVQPLIPKVLEHFKDPRIQPILNDDTLKAFMMIASLLPHAIEKQSFALPQENELVVVVKLGVDISSFVEEQRAMRKKAVQPYLIAIQGSVTQEILNLFLVLDGFAMELGRTPIIRGIDWLFKACFVFNVHFPTSWKLFFRLCQTCFYNVFTRNEDDVPPACSQMYTRLMSL